LGETIERKADGQLNDSGEVKREIVERNLDRTACELVKQDEKKQRERNELIPK
jgi:hypothetical protein